MSLVFRAWRDTMARIIADIVPPGGKPLAGATASRCRVRAALRQRATASLGGIVIRLGLVTARAGGGWYIA